MTDRDRPSNGEWNHPTSDEGDANIHEIGLNRAGLGSPPADIDGSHRPDLFDIDATRLQSAGLGADPSTAGGLGSRLGNTREAPAASRAVGGAGVGAVSDEADTEETGAATRAVGSTGSVDPHDTDAEPGGDAESDMGAVNIGGAKRPGAGLGETRGGHPGPLPDTV